MAMSPIRHIVSALALAGTLAAHGTPAHAAPLLAIPGTRHFDDGGERYRGYRIEIAQDVPSAEIGRLRRAAEHQVDIAEATALDASTKAFLRRFPVIVRSGSSEGSHYSGGNNVTIAVEDPEDDRPILLHEYVHVYHFRKLPGGRNNPDILTYYGRGPGAGFYPPNSYVLTNQGELLAMTASVYRHGRLARKPFTRDELRQRQPVYYRCLTRLFGPVGA